MDTGLGPILKVAYPQVVATLVRVLGDMDAAMDAAQDALVKALQRWQVDGVPDNPVAWLVTVARNGAIDRLRRDQRVVSLDGDAVNLSSTPDVEVIESEIEDDMLRLIFTCCHPVLNTQSQLVLVLKVVLGFSVEEIARALLLSPAAAEKRITRAKGQLREADVAYEIPTAKQLPSRRDAVYRAIYLLFNEGFDRVQDSLIATSPLIDEAVRLARMVARMFRGDPEARALLALILLSSARLPARVDKAGVFVPLQDQERALWDQGLIREGVAIIDAVYAARHPPGSYQIQAGISAIHSQAVAAAATDWQQIVALYDKLLAIEPSPVVALNRMVALTFAGSLDEARVVLDALREEPQLQRYQAWYAALAFVEERCGHYEVAREAYQQAIALAPSTAHRAYLAQRLEQLGN